MKRKDQQQQNLQNNIMKYLLFLLFIVFISCSSENSISITGIKYLKVVYLPNDLTTYNRLDAVSFKMYSESNKKYAEHNESEIDLILNSELNSSEIDVRTMVEIHTANDTIFLFYNKFGNVKYGNKIYEGNLDQMNKFRNEKY